MAKAVPITIRSPWEDRWNRPTLEQLVQPQREQTLPVMQALLEQLGELENVQQSLIWYGPAWKWTIQFTLHDNKGKEVDKLAYIVPNPEGFVVSVPLAEKVVSQLPIRRLNKVIRDAVRSAKQAVELHWATWTPNSASDIEHLMDLLKRKQKIVLGIK